MNRIGPCLLMALSLVACRGVAEGSFDGVDGGVVEDSGGEAAFDATTEPDATVTRSDGGGTTDAGAPGDGGRNSDVGAALDAGPVGSAGCASGAGLAEGEHTFMLGGRERRYILRLPQNYDPAQPWPVVLALHGNGGSASYWDGTDGDRNIRGVLQNSAILVVAEAIEGNWRDYNADRSTWPARIEAELDYFDYVLEELRTDLCVDEQSLFSMGFSGGGSFSGVLGCRRTDIRAIAVGGSVIYFDEANCVGTPAAWVTIGTQELTDGREAYRDFFRDRAGCGATSADTEPSPCVAYDGCDAATPVHYCQHPDGHIWPNFGREAMWQFFSQFVDGG